MVAHVSTPVYEGPFDRSFIVDVQAGKFAVREGIVAKGVHTRRQRKGKADQDVWMAKVKTRVWLEELARRAEESDDLRREYEQDIDILRLASELVVDDIVEPEDLRDELVRRFAAARGQDRTPPRRRHGISPA